MTELKKENRPSIILEEIDFKKPSVDVDTNSEPKKYQLLKELKKDISFVSIVSITLFAILGNISIYMLNKNPPSVTYIPKQVNLSESDSIIKSANIAANQLLNFNSTSLNNTQHLNNVFYKDGLQQWQSTLKQIGLYDKVLNNKGDVSTKILGTEIMSKTIVHGMVRNIVKIPYLQTYQDQHETTVTEGSLILTIIENPDQENQFLISNSHIFTENSSSNTK